MNKLNVSNLKLSVTNSENTSGDVQRSISGARSTDSTRVSKFTKELSGPTVILGMLSCNLFLFYCFVSFIRN